MMKRDILTAPQRKFPGLRGDAFLAACKVGLGAEFLYQAVQCPARTAAPFATIRLPMERLAAKIAWRLNRIGAARGHHLADYPHPHIVEVTELLALIFAEPPVETYPADKIGARFWNWWDWAAGDAGQAHRPGDNRFSDLAADERLAAAAAAMAMFDARTPVRGNC